jgi:hypothetical protein
VAAGLSLNLLIDMYLNLTAVATQFERIKSEPIELRLSILFPLTPLDILCHAGCQLQKVREEHSANLPAVYSRRWSQTFIICILPSERSIVTEATTVLPIE